MDKILATYFSRDPLLHVDMSELLKLDGACVLSAAPDGVLMKLYDMCSISTVSDQAARSLLPLLADANAVVLHQPYLIGEFAARRGFSFRMDCYNCAYFGSAPISYDLPENTEIRPLGQEHAEFVLAHYEATPGLEYIRKRIDAGMFGAFVGGRLAGFIGTHDEGSMGLLEILPEYRKMGLAYALEAHMANRQLSLGRLPFGQVKIHNTPSLNLQKKIGMAVSDKIVHWLARD